jgi:hypothetical protein
MELKMPLSSSFVSYHSTLFVERFVDTDEESLEEALTTSIVTMETFVLTSFVVSIKFSFLFTSSASHMQQASRRLHSCIERLEHGTMRARLQRQSSQRIGLSRKKASTDASQAFEPRYLLQHQHFWHSPYPWGIADVDCEDMIDLDECKVLIEHANRKFAKCTLNRRCRKTGLYGHGKGRILVMAIRADGQRWYKFVDQPGTDVTLFAPFINEILADLGPWAPGRPRYCFTMDNLNVHHHPNVINAILTAGYRVVFRVPYRPIDGPIELLFNVYEGELRKRLWKIKNEADLVHETQNIIRSFGPFRPFFHKVGFR